MVAPALPPTRANPTPLWDNHPNDHNQLTAALQALIGGTFTGPVGMLCYPGLWNFYFPATAFGGAIAIPAGTIRSTRCAFVRPIDRIAISIGTTGTTTFRVAAYADTPTGPGALLAQTADIPANVGGIIESALAIDVGFCWLAVQNVGATAVATLGTLSLNPFYPGSTAQQVGQATTWEAAGQGAVVPNPWPLGLTVKGVNSTAPTIYVRGAP